MNGFSIYICFGKYAGFRIVKDGFVLRIVLGFLAIGFMSRDLEQFLNDVVDLIEDLDGKKQ